MTAAAPLAPGRGHALVELDPERPGSRSPLSFYYYLPSPERFCPEKTPIVFVVHGLQRDADAYFDAVVSSGEPERLGVFLLVPAFSEELFPKKAGYNFGHVFSKDPERWTPGASGRVLPPLNPRKSWAFAALERCFDDARARTGSLAETYDLIGHSAGSQFAHRHVLLYGASGSEATLRVRRCVCANAGWYTMPTLPARHAFPYGLKGLPQELLDVGSTATAVTGQNGRGRRAKAKAGKASAPAAEADGCAASVWNALARRATTICGQVEPEAAGSAEAEVERAAAASFVQAPIIVLLGDQDIDPSKPRPEIWRDTPEANEQGPHRFGRGHSFFEEGAAVAKALGVPFGWTLKVVPGVGHEGGKMAAVALRMLCDPEVNGEVDVSVLAHVSGGSLA